MYVKFSDIVWDTDDDTPDIELPTSIVIEFSDDFNPIEEGSDFLSDSFGWTIKSLNFRIVERHLFSLCHKSHVNKIKELVHMRYPEVQVESYEEDDSVRLFTFLELNQSLIGLVAKVFVKGLILGLQNQ